MLEKRFWMNKKFLIIVALLTGVVISLVTAKTLAYTDSAEFCQSCHIMNSVHESFMDSTHATLACNDCHLPHDSVTKKMIYKGKAGMGHVYYNTLGTAKIPNVLHATESTQKVVERNCVTCHQSTIKNINHDAKESCSSCHRQVPHGKGFKTDKFNEPPKQGELLENKGGF